MKTYHFPILLILLLTTACTHGPIGKVASIGWYKDYDIPAKEALTDTQYIPNLIQALNDKNNRIAMYSALALGKLGTKAESSLPALAEVALSDRILEVRMEAIKSLVLVGKEHLIMTNTLSEIMLNGRPGKIRVSAARALTMLGPSAAPAVPALTEALESRYHKVRNYAAKSLAYIGPPAADALPTLERVAMVDERKTIQDSAKEAIRRITYEERHPQE
ncbi:MAG: hypothetical protein GQ578_04040 [Desulfuromonadaceae bacterium]|nr:hypothetical protein [Desulfuromonadaceae bacterium]